MFDPKHIARLAKAMEGSEESAPEVPEEWLKDSLVPEAGNLFALGQLAPSTTEVNVLVGLDDVTAVNDLYGHEHGDRLIQQVGHQLAKVAKSHEGTIFRVHGDSFLVKFASEAQAVEFLRDSHAAMRELPPIGAYGSPSFAAGIGISQEDAQDALDRAKAEKGKRHGIYRDNPAADIGHGVCYVRNNLQGGMAPVAEEPEIPERYVSPKRTAPMQMREPAEVVQVGEEAEAEERKPRSPLLKAEASAQRPGQVPDFLLEVLGDAP